MWKGVIMWDRFDGFCPWNVLTANGVPLVGRL